MSDFKDIMKDKTNYLSELEVNTMLKFCLDNDRVRDYMLLLTLYNTGRRVSEIVGKRPYTRNVGLRPIDIREEESLIEFDVLKKNPIKRRDKEGKIRTKEWLKEHRTKRLPKRKLFPMTKSYLSKLIKYINVEGIGLRQRVFPLHRSRVNFLIWDLSAKCGIGRHNIKIHPHSFRHTFAIHLLKKNPNNPMALLHVKALLDHSDLRTTETYAQFTQSDIKETVDRALENED